MTMAIAVELLVAVLLTATIVWAIILDRRLRDLRSGRDGVRQSVADLVGAAQRAEAAVAALRRSADTAAVELAQRQTEAKAASEELAMLVGAAEGLADRLTKQAGTAARPAAPRPVAAPARLAGLVDEAGIARSFATRELRGAR